MDNDAIGDLFSGLGPVEIKRLFGGKGIYHNGLIVAIEIRGELMLKADAESCRGFRGGRLQAVDLHRIAPRQACLDALLERAGRRARRRRRDDAVGGEGLRGGEAGGEVRRTLPPREGR